MKAFRIDMWQSVDRKRQLNDGAKKPECNKSSRSIGSSSNLFVQYKLFTLLMACNINRSTGHRQTAAEKHCVCARAKMKTWLLHGWNWTAFRSTFIKTGREENSKLLLATISSLKINKRFFIIFCFVSNRLFWASVSNGGACSFFSLFFLFYHHLLLAFQMFIVQYIFSRIQFNDTLSWAEVSSFSFVLIN